MGHVDSLLDRSGPFLRGQQNRVKTKTKTNSNVSDDMARKRIAEAEMILEDK